MLEGLLGEDVFRIGVSAYLKRFTFKNAETDDLWTELQTATQNTVNVKKVKKMTYSLVPIYIIVFNII